MSIFDDIGDAFEDAGDAIVSAAEEAARIAEEIAKAVAEAAEEAARIAEEVAKAAAKAAEEAARIAAEEARAAKNTLERAVGEAADWVGEAASDFGSWVEDNAGDIAWTIGKGAAAIFAGPLGAAAVGAVEGGIEADQKGGDHFDILEGVGFGLAEGGTIGNPIAGQAVDYAKDVDKKMDEGKDFWDAVTEAGKDQPLESFKDADLLGNSPLYEAAVHAGVEAAQGGDAGEIIAAGIGGLADGAYGGTIAGDAFAGAVDGFAHGIADGKSGPALWEATAGGAANGAVQFSPGLGFVVDAARDLGNGKSPDDRWEEIGDEAKDQAKDRVGLGLSVEPDMGALFADLPTTPAFTEEQIDDMARAESGNPATEEWGAAGTLLEMPSTPFDDFLSGPVIYGGTAGSGDYSLH
jgi:hypothetical protein